MTLWRTTIILFLFALFGSCDRARLDGRKHITWLAPMQLDRPLLEKLTDEFRAANPDIDVNLVWVPASQYPTKLKTLIAAGQTPDLFNCGDVLVAYLLPFLSDLSPYFERDAKEIDLPDIYPDVLRACQWNGRYYYVPRWFNTSLLYYNRAIFDAAHEPYPNANWTWDDYIAAAERLTKRDAKGNVEIWGSNIVTGWWGEWLLLVRQCGGEIFDKDMTHCLLDQPEAIRGFQFYTDKVHRQKVSPPPGFAPDQGFASGKIAMELGGHTGNWTLFNQINGLNWDIQILPRGPVTRSGGEISMEAIGMSKDSPEKEACWRYLKFMMSRTSVREHVDAGYLAIRKSVAGETLLSSSHTNYPHNVQAAYDSLEFAVSIPRSPDFIEIAMDVIQPEIDRMLIGPSDVTTTCKRATVAADRFISAVGSNRRENAPEAR